MLCPSRKSIYPRILYNRIYKNPMWNISKWHKLVVVNYLISYIKLLFIKIMVSLIILGLGFEVKSLFFKELPKLMDQLSIIGFQ